MYTNIFKKFFSLQLDLFPKFSPKIQHYLVRLRKAHITVILKIISAKYEILGLFLRKYEEIEISILRVKTLKKFLRFKNNYLITKSNIFLLIIIKINNSFFNNKKSDTKRKWKIIK